MSRILSAPSYEVLTDGTQRYVGPIVECDCGKFIACNMLNGNRCSWCDSKYDSTGRMELRAPFEDLLWEISKEIS
jgi:hypothetical protein